VFKSYSQDKPLNDVSSGYTSSDFEESIF